MYKYKSGMKFIKLVINSGLYYKKSYLFLFSGMVLSLVIVISSLFTGTSVKKSLLQIAEQRSAGFDYIIVRKGLFFSDSLVDKLQQNSNASFTGFLKLKAMASTPNSNYQLPDVNIIGFKAHTGAINPNKNVLLNDSVVYINAYLANYLQLKAGNEILLKIEKPDILPPESALLSSGEKFVLVRLKIGEVLPDAGIGSFSDQISQIPPFNIFVPHHLLRTYLKIPALINMIAVSDAENLSKQTLDTILKSNLKLSYLNYRFRHVPNSGYTDLITPEVFIPDIISDYVLTDSLSFRVLTYFAGFAKNNKQSSSYFFISGIENQPIKPNEVIVNSHLSNSLQSNISDSILFGYFKASAFNQLIVDSVRLKICTITNISGIFSDSLLTPHFEGVTNSKSCSNWVTDLPIDFSRIKDSDEAYWNSYKSTPKAFVNYNTAKALWGGPFGNATLIRSSNKNFEHLIGSYLKDKMNPGVFGFSVVPVKANFNKAATNSLDFGQLFLSLNFLLIIASLLVTVILYKYHLDKRLTEFAVLKVIGFRAKPMLWLYFSEILLLIPPALLTGIFTAIYFNKVIIYLLNTVWTDAVNTSMLTAHYSVTDIFTGSIIVVAMLLIILFIFLKKYFKTSEKQILANTYLSKPGFITKVAFIVIVVFLIGFMVYTLTIPVVDAAFHYLISGILLLLASGLALQYWLVKYSDKEKIGFNIRAYLLNDYSFNKRKFLLMYWLIAVGLYLTVSLAINRTDYLLDTNKVKSGSGGYGWYAETTIALPGNINNWETKRKLGIDTTFTNLYFTQMYATGGNNASCLNLNQVLQPAVIGVNPFEFAQNKAFDFAAVAKSLEIHTDTIWNLLNYNNDSVIYAIADQTVIQWNMLLAAGDTLVYLNNSGKKIYLVLVAGLKNSVFQGNILISDKAFKTHFLTSQTRNIILIKSTTSNITSLETNLKMSLSDFGLFIQPTAERLKMFNKVTNAYLDIFLYMGFLALVVSIFGVFVVIYRSLSEQEQTLAILKVVGFNLRNIKGILVKEYLFIIVIALMAGTLAAIFGAIPSILLNYSVNFRLVLGLTMVVFIQTWVSLIIIINRVISKNIIESIRNN